MRSSRKSSPFKVYPNLTERRAHHGISNVKTDFPQFYTANACYIDHKSDEKINIGLQHAVWTGDIHTYIHENT